MTIGPHRINSCGMTAKGKSVSANEGQMCGTPEDIDIVAPNIVFKPSDLRKD